MMKRIVRNYFLGFIWTFGLFLAGSDNDYMPWPNLLGMVIFGVAAWAMGGKKIRIGRPASELQRNRIRPIRKHREQNLASQLNEALSRISGEPERFRNKAFSPKS